MLVKKTRALEWQKTKQVELMVRGHPGFFQAACCEVQAQKFRFQFKTDFMQANRLL